MFEYDCHYGYHIIAFYCVSLSTAFVELANKFDEKVPNIIRKILITDQP